MVEAYVELVQRARDWFERAAAKETASAPPCSVALAPPATASCVAALKVAPPPKR